MYCLKYFKLPGKFTAKFVLREYHFSEEMLAGPHFLICVQRCFYDTVITLGGITLISPVVMITAAVIYCISIQNIYDTILCPMLFPQDDVDDGTR